MVELIDALDVREDLRHNIIRKHVMCAILHDTTKVENLQENRDNDVQVAASTTKQVIVYI